MITYIIIGITVLVSYLCFNNAELFRKLALIPYRTVKNNEWYRLITHGFVHADMTHLLVNMFTLSLIHIYLTSRIVHGKMCYNLFQGSADGLVVQLGYFARHGYLSVGSEEFG